MKPARWVVLFLLSLCIAHTAYAAGVAAGFAPGPVWLSRSAPQAGDSVRIYTVVYDATPTALEGSVSFSIDGTVIGSSPFSLAAGESSVESVEWKATEGAHQVSAVIASAIEKSSKAPATVASATTTALAVSVLPAPPAPAAAQALNAASAVVASSSPIVASVIETAKTATEGIRTAGVTFLENQAGITSATTSPRVAGDVLGAATYRADTPEAASAPKTGIAANIARSILPVFRYPAIFYPLFFLVLVVVLWILFKRLRHPGGTRRR